MGLLQINSALVLCTLCIMHLILVLEFTDATELATCDVFTFILFFCKILLQLL